MKPGGEGSGGDRAVHDRLGRLVNEHWEEMVYFAGTFTPWRSRETAEGIVQDGLVLVLERRISLPEDDHDALAIVMGVIRNVGRNRRRRDKVRETEVLDESDGSDPGDGQDSWTMAWRARASRDIDAAFASAGLTASERAVAEMHLLAGLTFSEIAKRRGGSARTAKNLYGRARKKVSEYLDDSYGPEFTPYL